MRQTLHQAEITSQIINHLANYLGDSHGEYMKFDKQTKDDVYEILPQIL